jgi:hypothetical protein
LDGNLEALNKASESIREGRENSHKQALELMAQMAQRERAEHQSKAIAEFRNWQAQEDARAEQLIPELRDPRQSGSGAAACCALPNRRAGHVARSNNAPMAHKPGIQKRRGTAFGE